LCEGERHKTSENLIRLREKEAFAKKLFKFSFCLSVAVNILYWTINFICSEFLGTTPVPKALDLFLHGGNMAVILIDAFLNTQGNKERQLISSNFLVKFTIFYLSLQYLVYYTLNIEVYPMISKLSVPAYSLVNAAGYGLFFLGHFFHDKVLVSF
jgi:hypothetical protein